MTAEEEEETEKVKLRAYKPKIPYPARLTTTNEDKDFKKFLEIFKRIQINIPFVEALAQMPKYAKFLKEIIMRKRSVEADDKLIVINEHCSAIIQKELPPKLADPGSYVLPCMIGNKNVGKALCDLGSSINVLPFPLFHRLGLGELEPVRMRLQLADRSVKAPMGIVRDILIKTGDFIFPVDFIVLDMDEDPEIPIILGRPFLVTGGAVIDVRHGHVTLRIGDEERVFDMTTTNRPIDQKKGEVMRDCKAIHVIETNNELHAHSPTHTKKPSALETVPNILKSVFLKNKSKTKPKQEKQAKQFETGQLVMLKNSGLQFFPQKLKWNGPFRIVELCSSGTVRIIGEGRELMVGRHRLKPWLEPDGMKLKF